MEDIIYAIGAVCVLVCVLALCLAIPMFFRELVIMFKDSIRNYRPPTPEEKLQQKLDMILFALFSDDD